MIEALIYKYFLPNILYMNDLLKIIFNQEDPGFFVDQPFKNLLKSSLKL